ncbi:MAG: methylmalonyl-CoA mutase family protein, partial [Syntrophales bacterium LBB04]|nr:methylmalonyl-CoA mutase family protein [Syntrophales bacterium LBB04]
LLGEIVAMGGAVEAVESGWMKLEVVKSAEEFQRKIETGEVIQVGINKYTEPEEIEVMVPRTSPYKAERKEDAEQRQIANLRKVKQERNSQKVQACLDKIGNAAKDEQVNLIPLFVEAVKEYTTVGEICGVLRNVFGEAR